MGDDRHSCCLYSWASGQRDQTANVRGNGGCRLLQAAVARRSAAVMGGGGGLGVLIWDFIAGMRKRVARRGLAAEIQSSDYR